MPVEPTKLSLDDVGREAPALLTYLRERAHGRCKWGSGHDEVRRLCGKWGWESAGDLDWFARRNSDGAAWTGRAADVLAHERAATRPALSELPEAVRRYAAWCATSEPDTAASRALAAEAMAAGYCVHPRGLSGEDFVYGMRVSASPAGACEWEYTAAEIRAATAPAQPAAAAPSATLADVPRGFLEVYREYLDGVPWSALYERAVKCRDAWVGSGSYTSGDVTFTRTDGAVVKTTRAELSAELARRDAVERAESAVAAGATVEREYPAVRLQDVPRGLLANVAHERAFPSVYQETDRDWATWTARRKTDTAIEVWRGGYDPPPMGVTRFSLADVRAHLAATEPSRVAPAAAPAPQNAMGITWDGAALSSYRVTSLGPAETNVSYLGAGQWRADMDEATGRISIKWEGAGEGATTMGTTTKPSEQVTPDTSIATVLKADATAAAVRSGARQAVRLARDPLAALLERHVADDSARAAIAAFLRTEAGTALLGLALGGLLAVVPGAPPAAQLLARELRVAALSGGADIVLDAATTPLLKLLAQVIRDNPALAVTAQPAALGEGDGRVLEMRAAAKAEVG